jgi:protein TonB
LDDPVVLGFPLNGQSYFLSLEVKKASGAEVGRIAIKPGEGELNWRQARSLLPQPAFTVTPTYPEKCKKENIQGWVALYVFTNIEGKVIRVRVLGSSHPELAKSAIEAIRQWTYRPVIWKGKPIQSEFYMTVDFRLRDLSPSAEDSEKQNEQ